MDLNFITDPSRQAAYIRNQASPAQTAAKASAPTVQDVFDLSPEARAAMAREAGAVTAVMEETAAPGAAFPSFSEEFCKVTQGYSNIIREHYAQEHAENLAAPDPKAHVWDKYKNPESPSFRSDLSEDERAWAYDQELDLLNGGNHLQMGNPYAFPDGAPTLASAAMQACQACREQTGRAIQDLLAQNDISLPDGVSVRLAVDDSYTIHVSGLEDGELAASVEEALNAGDNGKNLYNLLKITGETGVNYADGRLEALDLQQELSEEALDEVRKQACPAYAQYSAAYDPHQEPLGMIVGPGGSQPSQEEADRACAAVRVGAPELLARFRAGEFGNPDLTVNKYASVDPDGSIMAGAYIQAYARQAAEAKEVIRDYYAAANRENSSFPFAEGVQHIREKYKLPDSDIFRSDLTERQRDMYFRQEMALLTGGPLTMLDPYALASVGGVQDAGAMRDAAMQAAAAKLDALWAEMYGVEG